MQSRSAEERREELVDLFHEASGCVRCPLHRGRTKVVFGSGNANADLMFVGEAPGQQEDLQGLPFVGRAGKLLDQLLEEVGLQRSDVFITNVLLCRPPGNRDPQQDEIDTCKPYLHRKIELIEPKVICTLGNFATKLLTRSQRGITAVHGQPQVHELGSGKTTFVRGACRALGVDGPVTSPTFTIGHVYAGARERARSLEIAHLDLYRLGSLAGEDPALLEDYLTPERIAFVEWPELAEPAFDHVAARVLLEHAGG